MTQLRVGRGFDEACGHARAAYAGKTPGVFKKSLEQGAEKFRPELTLVKTDGTNLHRRRPLLGLCPRDVDFASLSFNACNIGPGPTAGGIVFTLVLPTLEKFATGDSPWLQSGREARFENRRMKLRPCSAMEYEPARLAAMAPDADVILIAGYQGSVRQGATGYVNFYTAAYGRLSPAVGPHSEQPGTAHVMAELYLSDEGAHRWSMPPSSGWAYAA